MPIFQGILGDFIARSPLFWEGDSETQEGRLFNNFLISNHLEQLISEPTHARDDGSQSCIDLICTDQPYLFKETGVLPSLDPHPKHNIIHGTLNISIPHPPQSNVILGFIENGLTEEEILMITITFVNT